MEELIIRRITELPELVKFNIFLYYCHSPYTKSYQTKNKKPKSALNFPLYKKMDFISYPIAKKWCSCCGEYIHGLQSVKCFTCSEITCYVCCYAGRVCCRRPNLIKYN